MEARLDALLDYCVPDVFARGVLVIDSALQHSLGDAGDAAAYRRDLWCCSFFSSLICFIRDWRLACWALLVSVLAMSLALLPMVAYN